MFEGCFVRIGRGEAVLLPSRARQGMLNNLGYYRVA